MTPELVFRTRDADERLQEEAFNRFLRIILQLAVQGDAAAYALGIRQAERELRVTGLFDPEGQAFMESFIVAAIRGVADDTRRRVNLSLLESFRDGVGQDVAARRLRDAFLAPESRLRMIARTELNRAGNWGRFRAWVRSGIVQEKEAIATFDDRVRPDHLAAHGDRVPIDQPFRRGAARGLMAPPWAPNCRCSMVPVTAFGFQRKDDQVVTQEIPGLVGLENQETRTWVDALNDYRDEIHQAVAS